METGKIRVLSDDVICRIAAGEVVERPASVVKELLENAIDAGASKIEIEIKDGGQKLIEVTDNGEGMNRQDAMLAFTPHATSKIKTDTDLDDINSLGFRGEALPTIASVARVTMVTKHESEDTATKMQIDGGKVSGVDSTTFPRGTRIQVKNLFYNVPARRKFLKSIQAEMAQISDVVCHYMMGYPEIAFRFSKNNIKLAHSTGSGNLIDAILAVYGPDVARSLLPLKEPASLAGKGISIKGFISPPNEARPSSRYMTTLVNRRFVKTKLLSQAISKAISAFFPKGRYPLLVLDLRLPPTLLDVNVHPQKTEIRFKEERQIFGIIWETIQTSLSGLRMVTAPTTSDSEQIQTNDLPSLNETETKTYTSRLPENVTMFPSGSSAPAKVHQPVSNSDNSNKIYELKEVQTVAPAPTGQALAPVRQLTNPRILAQLKNTYLLGEDDEGMFIVDQHVAHERVLFDQYVSTYKDKSISAQPLLFPIPLQLLPSERMIVKDQIPELKKLGFSIQQEEDGQFYATAVPIPEGKETEESSIQNVLSEILNGWESQTQGELKIELLKMMSCKAAIKAGDPLESSEWNSLLEQLLKTENPFTCPHGRPIVLRLSTTQIERSFLRI